MKGIVKDLDRGFYHEARGKNVTALSYLAQMINPEPDEVKPIREQLYDRYPLVRHSGGVYRQTVDEFAVQLCALGKEMGARGISRHDTVEHAFFTSVNATSSQPLFPVFLAAHIIAGQLANSLVSMLCAADNRITSHVQEKVTLADTTATRQLRHIGEGTDLPKTTITTTGGSVALQKYGRLLEVSYEAARVMSLDVIGLEMQRIGMQTGIDETDDLIETAVIGDGNSNTAATNTNVQSSGILAYTDLVSLFQAFGIGYRMRNCVVNDTHMRSMLAMPQFSDPVAFARVFQTTGDLPQAFGAHWHRWTSTGSSSWGTNKILALDTNAAIVCLREGDMLEEADSLIDKQLHQRSMSEWVGFMVWDPASAQTLTV
jgi:hypothetical protein